MQRSSDAVTRALAQPHIVQSICDQLPKESLTDVAQVNHIFFSFATKIKWFSGPLWVLQQRVQISRRQMYASKIRYFDEDQLPWVNHRAFRRIVFDGLDNLIVDDYRGMHGRHASLGSFFTSALPILYLDGGVIDAPLFIFMAERCNQLRQLRLNSNEYVDSQALAVFLAACQSLEVLQLYPYLNEQPLDPSLITQCARQPRLRILHFPRRMQLPTNAAKIIESEVSHPFASLELIQAAVHLDAVALFCKYLSKVVRLELDIIGCSSSLVAQPLSQLRALKTIRLRVPAHYNFSEPEMMSLCSLHMLESISLITEDENYPALASLALSASQFERWISHFPHLEEFAMSLRVPAEKYNAALVALGSHCPKLLYCEWPAEIDLSSLQLDSRPEPLFPKLRSMHSPSAVSSADDADFPQ